MRFAFQLSRIGSAITLLLVFACNLIVGIPERELDPKFPACDKYCQTVMSVCTGEHAVYTTNNVCIGSCLALPQGEAAEAVGTNTVACRSLVAETIQKGGTNITPDLCPLASLGGGNPFPEIDFKERICGTNCEGYCSAIFSICKGQPNLFSSQEKCLSECAKVPDIGRFNISQITGHSIQCRLYHLSAATENPQIHCPHALGLNLCTLI